MCVFALVWLLFIFPLGIYVLYFCPIFSLFHKMLNTIGVEVIIYLYNKVSSKRVWANIKKMKGPISSFQTWFNWTVTFKPFDFSRWMTYKLNFTNCITANYCDIFPPVKHLVHQECLSSARVFWIDMILSQRRERVTQKVFLYESAPPNK